MALKVTIFVFRCLRFETLWCFSETPNIWRYYFLHCLVFKEHVARFTACRGNQLIYVNTTCLSCQHIFSQCFCHYTFTATYPGYHNHLIVSTYSNHYSRISCGK